MSTVDDSLAIETHGVGKRYGSQWALQDCTLAVPRGRVTALVGPNGAGKSTLLRLLVGLAAPTTGRAQVLGRPPAQNDGFLDSIGYLAQDVPLYRRLTAEDHLGLGAHLNRHWDAQGARARLSRLQIPLDRPVAKLSGGQRAQIGLGLALAKRPQVLLLDEPVAALDPLARREFLASLSEAVAEGETKTWQRMYALNVLTALNASRSAIPYLSASGAGRIVNVGAMGALQAGAGMGAYAASKAGVHRLTEALAAEWKGRITVNAVLPSTIDTAANRASMPKADFTKWVTPQELAEVILFLVSDAASAVTGALIPVSGRV